MVSIIVPVYNVEEYLRRCLDSIVSQTLQDFECILVDDASPDNCPRICDEYVEKDKRFKVIHKKQNEGLPRARKSGLDIASGEFIMHVDSDDWIENNALELLLSKQRETDADMVIGAAKFVYKYYKRLELTKDIKYYNSALEASCDNLMYRFLWGKLYKKYFFNDYIIPKYGIGEDAVVNMQIYSKIKKEKIAIISDVVYNYNRITKTNITRKEKIECSSMFEYPRISYILWIENYLKEKKLLDAVKNAYILFFIKFGIVPFLRYVNQPKREDVEYIYKNYYLDFPEKMKVRLFQRSLINVYYKSIALGKIYASLQRLLIKIVKQ